MKFLIKLMRFAGHHRLKFLFLIAMVTLLILDHSNFNGIDEADDNTWVKRGYNRIYFVLATMSTVGYGDISPMATNERMACIFLEVSD